MKVLLVAAAVPPSRCGVGDYTFRLAAQMAKRGQCLPAVLTSTMAANSEQFPVIHGNSVCIGYRDALLAIKSFRPDVVHIQYPSMGPVSALVPFVTSKFAGLPVAQTWHEHFRECIQLSYANLLGIDALVYVRENLLERLPPLVRFFLKSTLTAHVPNASAIASIVLAPPEHDAIRKRFAVDRNIVTFFGFAHPNKGVHTLFEIADPDRHHLVLICDLDPADEYQAGLLKTIESPRWREHVTVTGFLPELEVAKLLAASDAVIFPFTDGVGFWNTTLLAALNSGTMVAGTTNDGLLCGYNPSMNMFLALCGDINGMKTGLNDYAGRRRKATSSERPWADLAAAHEAIYARLLKQ